MNGKTVQERYPAVYQRVRSYLEANGDKSFSPSELVRALGFITREEVIRQVLDGADWAAEENGRYFRTDPAGNGRGARPVPASDAEGSGMNDVLAQRLKRVLERETARNRIGVSVLYLKRLCGNPEDGEIRRILSGAPWASERYGYYRYVRPEAEEDVEKHDRQGLGAEAVRVEEARPETASAEAKSAPVCEQLRMDPGECREGSSGTAAEDDAEKAGTAGEETPLLREVADPMSPTVKKARSGGDGWVQMSMEIPDDGREEMRVGTVLKVKKRARYWSVTVDLGPRYGRAAAKWPSGPEAEGLIGQQVVCGIRNGADGRQIRLVGIGQEGGMVAVEPAERVRNGERVE